MIARGEYSLIFASIGFGAGAISRSLYQFTGAYVFIMTLLAPIAMKNSPAIKKVITGILPGFLKQGIKNTARNLRASLKPGAEE
jgi:Kef-type K+ transport system membrane component KefB